MKNIIKLIIRYHFTIVFILLELIAFSLIVNHNNYQRSVFLNKTSSFSAYISSGFFAIKSYFSLRSANEKLVEENTNLRNQLHLLSLLKDNMETDTLWAESNYRYIAGKIVNANFNKTKNYLTLNKGELDAIQENMGIISNEGIVGIVQNTSNRYAIVMPLINTNLSVSAKIKKNGYYGALKWDGNDYKYSYLNDISFHVDVQPGDTIVTSGYSSIFPEGLLIGFVENVHQTANFLKIKVKLATDFGKLSDVYAIENKEREEELVLEAEYLSE